MGGRRETVTHDEVLHSRMEVQIGDGPTFRDPATAHARAGAPSNQRNVPGCLSCEAYEIALAEAEKQADLGKA